jgi:hypothetical protein
VPDLVPWTASADRGGASAANAFLNAALERLGLLDIHHHNHDVNFTNSWTTLMIGCSSSPRSWTDFKVAGNWRNKLTKGLIAADALVAVLTESALESRYVLGEIGAGRAMEYSKQMLLIPVLPGPIRIPDFLNDVFCFRLKNGAVDALVDELGAPLAMTWRWFRLI